MNLYNIPIARPFFISFVKSLLAGKIIKTIYPGCDPLNFSKLTVFVPTRRAAQALAHVFATELSPAPVILPKIIPLGDPDDMNERSLLNEDTFNSAEPSVNGILSIKRELLPEITPLSRRLHLMLLIESWRKAIRPSLSEITTARGALLDPDDLFQVASSPADAFGLAGDLAYLMDEMIIEQADWRKLGGLAPDHDDYWSLTLQFLEIASEAWPKYLEEQNLMDHIERRQLLLTSQTKILLNEKPLDSMIVAGSTGSQPATAALMAAIAALPNGAVILPGLDQELSNEDWNSIVTSGPDTALGLTSQQALLKRLVNETMHANRTDVFDIGADMHDWEVPRRHLISEILRPADTTDQWAKKNSHLGDARACEGLTVIETADEREEALSIALVMRKTLAETDNNGKATKQIALVTPDRALATRVSAELKRFDLHVSDSAGCPLSSEPRGVLARLALDVATSSFDPANLMALLYHPLVTLGLAKDKLVAAVAALDICVMRSAYAGTSINALKQAVGAAKSQALYRMPASQRRLMDGFEILCSDLINRLDKALSPLATALANESSTLLDLAHLHEAAICALSKDEQDIDHHFEDADGNTLFDVFNALFAEGASKNQISAGLTYEAMFDALTRSQPVHHKTRSHPRLHIWGPLEARLLEVDVVILGALNEGSWPPSVNTDAFLNRPMRSAIGLSPPERRIGQSAHDFAMLMGMERVVLTRSGRKEDQPTIASRFLRRMKAYLGKDVYDNLQGKGEEFVNLARHLDDAVTGFVTDPMPRPEPKPDVDLRPMRLSITEIETLYRDPYAIYAKHVLKLDPLEDRFPEPGASDRGSIVHDVLAEFVETYPASLPENSFEKLLNIGERHFASFKQYPDVSTYWWPRFKITASWFIEDFEPKRRALGIKPFIERDGALKFDLSDGSVFTLRGRADRIDLNLDGSFSVIDYKTGSAPSVKQVIAGFSPQLTLEAAIVQAGGFKNITPQRCLSEMMYVKLMGSASEPGSVTKIYDKTRSLDDLAATHLHQLKSHLYRYRSPQKGYVSRRAPVKVNYVLPYDHLARVKEWTDIDDIEGGDVET